MRGAKHIIHAGDVGAPEILETLTTVAPVSAIAGNIDRGNIDRSNIDKDDWARGLPETAVVELAGISIYVLHDLAQLDLKPRAAGFKVVISGHSHVARQETRDGVLYFNPGSAGPRRFKLPVTVGRLIIENASVQAEIISVL